MRYEWGRDHQLLCDGQVVGTAERSWWRERATVTTETATWSFRAQGWSRVLVTGADGAERLAATRRGWFTESWTVTGDAATYDLRPAHAFTSRLTVRRGAEQVGEVTAARWWSDRPALELAADVPLADAVLLLWVAYVVRQRITESGSSGGAVGAAT